MGVFLVLILFFKVISVLKVRFDRFFYFGLGLGIVGERVEIRLGLVWWRYIFKVIYRCGSW